ncbi:hypothetical protein CAPTEDRAFT_191006 [Capitella teleta]|uniref:Uncharacterized protein n=1 Tax=Capitella teleta TaxID=283909 RepID=R7TML1_CAPTE|nr:hypothetical protein CAPTEDRAFT_191006 [Capitella teleta]|eukprot:ELT94772.1 hypothetical protein CAPTEDRAFT_191006 [Capitella teleta]
MPIIITSKSKNSQRVADILQQDPGVTRGSARTRIFCKFYQHGKQKNGGQQTPLVQTMCQEECSNWVGKQDFKNDPETDGKHLKLSNIFSQAQPKTAENSHELNHDICLWFALDLRIKKILYQALPICGATRKIHPRKDAVSIKDHILGSVTKFISFDDLKDKVVFTTHDGASVMKKTS